MVEAEEKERRRSQKTWMEVGEEGDSDDTDKTREKKM